MPKMLRLVENAEVKRSPLKRGKPRSHNSTLANQSRKRQRENRERAKVLAEMRAENPYCSFPECKELGVDGHELLRRSAGGSITDRANIVLMCRLHHTYVTEHPRWALENGFQISRHRRQD